MKFLLFLFSHHPNLADHYGHTVYYTHDGVLCDISKQEKCGMTLTKCDNKVTYLCATNVEMVSAE